MNMSPFHQGEQWVQEKLGVRRSVEPLAKQMIRPFMPDQHREFFTKLPYIVVAARDEEQRPWVTLLVGKPGFIASPAPTTLVIDSKLNSGDALETSLSANKSIALLGIELDTRRRNRVNGTISDLQDQKINFSVGQSFGNCPQYITNRSWRHVVVDKEKVSVSQHSELTLAMQQWIKTADTFFIASGNEQAQIEEESPANGLDASHRGGSPGFVEIQSDSRLIFPDYSGNNHFNTIGNLVIDPRVGLLFLDFRTGSMLQLTGKASIDWHSNEVTKRAGAQRLVSIEIESIVLLENVLSIRWDDPDLIETQMTVVRIKQESESVKSFYLEASDGQPRDTFRAGQYLPISVKLADSDRYAHRSYTLSSNPSDNLYRVSVKREPNGIVSNYLHDQINEGDSLRTGIPVGEFSLQSSSRPIVLVSAGIGITPMISMLYELLNSDDQHPVHFIHGSKNSQSNALIAEAETLVTPRANASLDIAYSKPLEGDISRNVNAIDGRISISLISKRVPSLDADYYICGPNSFMSELIDSLLQQGVRQHQIFTESFGPVPGISRDSRLAQGQSA